MWIECCNIICQLTYPWTFLSPIMNSSFSFPFPPTCIYAFIGITVYYSHKKVPRVLSSHYLSYCGLSGSFRMVQFMNGGCGVS